MEANAPRPFDLVWENLRKIGAVPISEYLSRQDAVPITGHLSKEEASAHHVDVPANLEFNPSTSLIHPKDSEQLIIPASTSFTDQTGYMTQLERTFRSAHPDHSLADALRFEISQRSGDPNGIQCILVITRPEGAFRAYKSEACHSQEHAAEMQAAQVAVEKGAVDFILHGDSKVKESKTETGKLATPQDIQPVEGGVEDGEIDDSVSRQATPTRQDEVATRPESTSAEELEPVKDPRVLEIENACKQHWPENLPPDWVFFCTENEEINSRRWGAALRVHLAVPRVYASDMIYHTAHEAQATCAQLAIDQKVFHLIKDTASNIAIPQTVAVKQKPPPKPTGAVSLQAWFDALPRPLPKFFDTKTVSGIGAISLLNEWVTKARGARLKLQYFWPTEPTQGLFGCVLRVDRPKECRAYLVDPIFVKRGDAKTAVCLLAMINGVGEYIRTAGIEVENKITPRLRALAHSQIFPMLGQKGAGDSYIWTFQIDRDAFGCTLTVGLGSEEHRYVAEPEYRTKADAKVAAALVAAELGLPELLRFRGEPLPPGYRTFWETAQGQQNGTTIHAKSQKPQKRKKIEGDIEHAMEAESKRARKRMRTKAPKEAEGAAQQQGGTSGGSVESSKTTTAGPSSLPPSGALVSEKALGKRSAIATTAPKEAEGATQQQGGVSGGSVESSKTTATGPPPLPSSGALVNEKVPGKRSAIASSSSTSISGGVALGTVTKPQPKAVPLSYERLPPSSTSHTPIHPLPRPPPPPSSGHNLPQRPLPLPYDYVSPPAPQHAFPGFGAAYPQYYPFPTQLSPHLHAPLPPHPMHPMAPPSLYSREGGYMAPPRGEASRSTRPLMPRPFDRQLGDMVQPRKRHS
ncbi:hypothetical protein D9615_003163 [Tricholomella constricta]|uniref:Uncharacterized protein n=1 Tax=Tricholomella constricta TaxID=117010 RepID=A0A8H5HJC4_9AGAR|nr:hypothetical protein D9615_003163 [Tricholomella constricta]